MAVICIYRLKYKKIFKPLLLQNHWADLADILHEAYGAPSYIKQLNCSGRIINVPKVGGVNLENDVKFQIHGPFEPGSSFFIGFCRQCTDAIYEVFIKITWQPGNPS